MTVTGLSSASTGRRWGFASAAPQERVAPIDAPLSDSGIPLLFAERAIDQVPELTYLQGTLICHPLG
jgi:hypothetical protein